MPRQAAAFPRDRRGALERIDRAPPLSAQSLGSAGTAARAEIESALARTLELVDETGAKAFEPLIHVELAELARQSGDHDVRERELGTAHRLFTEIGASGHVERLAGELAISAS